MKTIKPFSGTALFVRAFMLTIILITGGGNSAWADTVLKTIDFSDPEWSDVTFTQGASDAPETINGVTFNAKSGSYHFSIADGKLNLPSVTPSSGNYFLGFPVTGIVAGIVYVKVYNGSSYQAFKHTIKDGGTAFSTSDCGNGATLYSGYATKTGLTDTKAYVYIGRASTSSSYSTITKIEVLTPELTNLETSTFYPLFKESNSETNSSLTSDLPTFLAVDDLYSIPDYSTNNTSSVDTPYDFTSLSSDKYYRLRTSASSKIIMGGLSRVKSIRIYGNGSDYDGTINISVTKLSGEGSAMSISGVNYENSKSTIVEYSSGDLTLLDGYNADTYYLYTITIAKRTGSFAYFSLWGIYIETTSSCTSVAAPTSLSCSAHSKSSLTFSWTAAENASAYTATLYSDSECSEQVNQTTGIGIISPSVTFSGLSGSTTYYCKVQSNGDGETYCTEGNVTDAASGTTDSKDYTVTVESNNDSYGTASAGDSGLDEGETTTVTATPETGYKFRSWAVSGTGAKLSSTTINPTTLTMGTADATVTATFSALETYTITYNAGSAEGITGSKASETKTEDAAFTLPSSAVFTRSGYLQTGWATSDGGDKAYELGGTYTGNEDLDLYPYWIEQYTITYDNNGGMGSMTVTTGAGVVTLRATSFVKSGHTFLGWATSDDKADAGIVEYANQDEYTLSGDVTLYAVWGENYCVMKVATSGDAITAGNVVTMQSGAFGGTMTVESTGANLTYGSSGITSPAGYNSTLTVALNDYMRPGTVILLTLYNFYSAGYERGYKLVSSDDTDISTMSFTTSNESQFLYTVTAEDALNGTNIFKLVKVNTNGIAIKSLTVTDCQPGGVISASGWNTYSSNKRLDLSTISGGTAYVASSTEDGRVQMDRCTDIVAANAGLLIHGTPGDNFTINATGSDVTFDGTNLLVGVPNGGEAPVGSYVFGWPTADPTSYGFYYVNSSAVALGAGKSYLSTGGGGGARLILVFNEDETTGISTIANSQEPTSCFDLQGRKVVSPTKGLYIKNGKKVFVGEKR